MAGDALLGAPQFQNRNVVISTNKSYEKIAIERGSKDPANVFVVRSGPVLDRLEILPPNPKWLNGRKAMVGYVGVIGEQEGMDLFLPAVREVVIEQGRDVQFVIVGSGPGLAEAQQMATDLGVADHVTFTGRAPDHDLFEVLSTSDVCVNPDSVNEFNDKCTMNKILEYMAFSKPIVQFEMTEGRNSAHEASLYAAPNDSNDMAARIIELLDDPDRCAEMGRVGRERVETVLSWDWQVQALIDAYQRVQKA